MTLSPQVMSLLMAWSWSRSELAPKQAEEALLRGFAAGAEPDVVHFNKLLDIYGKSNLYDAPEVRPQTDLADRLDEWMNGLFPDSITKYLVLWLLHCLFCKKLEGREPNTNNLDTDQFNQPVSPLSIFARLARLYYSYLQFSFLSLPSSVSTVVQFIGPSLFPSLIMVN